MSTRCARGAPLLLLWLGFGWFLAGWGVPSVQRAQDLGLTGPDAFAPILAHSSEALERRRQEGVVRPDPSADPNQITRIQRRYLLFTEDPDEGNTVMALAAMRPRALDLNPRFFFYGGAYIYGSGAALILGVASGYLPRTLTLAHFITHPDDMGRVYRLLRLFVFVIVAITAVLLGWGLAPGGSEGLCAVLFLLSPAVAAWSLDAKPHAAGLLPWVGAWWASRRVMENPAPRAILLAGVFSGLAAGTVTTYGLALLMPLLAVVLARPRPPLPDLLRAAALAGAGAAVTFLITNPYVLLAPDWVRRDFLYQDAYYPEPARLSRLVPGIWFFLVRCVFPAVGPGIFAAGLLGLARALRQDPRGIVIGTVPILFYGTYMGARLCGLSLDRTVMRFALPAVPLFVHGALLLLHAVRRLGPRPHGLLAAALVLATFPGALDSYVAYALRAWGGGPPPAARDWILANLPASDVIGTFWDPAPFNCPPLDPVRHRVVRFQEAPPDPAPRWWITVRGEPVPPGYTLHQEFPVEVLGWRLDPPILLASPLRLHRRLPGSPVAPTRQGWYLDLRPEASARPRARPGKALESHGRALSRSPQESPAPDRH